MTKKDFLKFYKTNFDKIYRFVFFRARGNKELAEDLTSEIFIKALEHFEDYNSDISRSAWIYTIARNHLSNFFRDNKKTFLSLEEITLDGEFEIDVQKEAGLSFDGLEHLIQKDAEREILELLANLSEDKRRLVTLKYLLGYSFKEVAEIIGGTENAVKVAAHRALKELKTMRREKK